MYRNTVIYHRLWYFRKRNIKRLHFYVKVMIVLTIFLLIGNCIEKKLFPEAVDISKNRTEALIYSAFDGTIKSRISETLRSENFFVTENNHKANIVEVKSNNASLQLLRGEFLKKIQDAIYSVNKNGSNYITLPLNILFGTIHSDRTRYLPVDVYLPQAASGFKFRVRYQIDSKVSVKLYVDIVPYGKNQVLCKLIFEINASIYVFMPLSRKTTQIDIEIPYTKALTYTGYGENADASDKSTQVYSLP